MVRRKTAEASLVGKTSLRVRFSEVDSMQIVWHGEYVRYFEDGREAFGREFAGLGYMDIHASGYTAPIVELQLQYKKPLRVNDTAVVETRYIATEAAKICFEYTIRSATDGEIVAEGSSTQVFLDARGELQLLAPEFYRKWKESMGREVAVWWGPDSILSALGFGTRENMEAVRAGRTNLSVWHDGTPVCRIDPERFAQLTAERAVAEYTPAERLALLTLGEVIARSGVSPANERTLILLSTTKGNIGLLNGDPAKCDLNDTAEVVGKYFGAANRPLVISNACISGVSAIVVASRLIRSGEYDHVFVAGFDLLCDFIVSGFNAFKSVSPVLCRPYDAARDGLTLGEAGGAVLLTADRGLSATGITVAGGGISNDANHISAPSRTGDGLAFAIRAALREASLGAAAIGMVNPHGHGDALQRRDGEPGTASRRTVRHALQLTETLFRAYARRFGRHRKHRHGARTGRRERLRRQRLCGVRSALPAEHKRRTPHDPDGRRAENSIGIRRLQRRGGIPARDGPERIRHGRDGQHGRECRGGAKRRFRRTILRRRKSRPSGRDKRRRNRPGRRTEQTQAGNSRRTTRIHRSGRE